MSKSQARSRKRLEGLQDGLSAVDATLSTTDLDRRSINHEAQDTADTGALCCLPTTGMKGGGGEAWGLTLEAQAHCRGHLPGEESRVD